MPGATFRQLCEAVAERIECLLESESHDEVGKVAALAAAILA